MNNQERPLLDVSRDDIVPYFIWDYQYTVGEVKKMLAEGDENQRLWLMAKIMRDAPYSDVWKFISLIKSLSTDESRRYRDPTIDWLILKSTPSSP